MAILLSTSIRGGIVPYQFFNSVKVTIPSLDAIAYEYYRLSIPYSFGHLIQLKSCGRSADGVTPPAMAYAVFVGAKENFMDIADGSIIHNTNCSELFNFESLSIPWVNLEPIESKSVFLWVCNNLETPGIGLLDLELCFSSRSGSGVVYINDGEPPQ